MRPCGAAPKSSCCSQVLLGVSGWAGTPTVGQSRPRVGVDRRPRPSLQANVVLFYPASPKPGTFLTGLSELCGRCPHWSLLQLLTEVGAPDGECQGGGLCQSPPLSLLYRFSHMLPTHSLYNTILQFIVYTHGRHGPAFHPPPMPSLTPTPTLQHLPISTPLLQLLPLLATPCLLSR